MLGLILVLGLIDRLTLELGLLDNDTLALGLRLDDGDTERPIIPLL